MPNSYWGNNGKYQTLAEKLQTLIPVMGSVDNVDDNPKLEKFREAVNAYYDIFNNGGMNRLKEIRSIFKFGMRRFSIGRSYDWDGLMDATNPIMDKIILNAAKEQKISVDS